MGEHDDSIAHAVGIEPTVIIESKGKEYELAPLLMEDMGVIEKFAKAQHRQEALIFIREAGDLLSPEDKARMLKELSGDLSGGIAEADEDILRLTPEWTWLDEMSSPAVISFVITLRLRKGYPEMTKEEAKNIITVDAVAAVRGEMSALLGLDAFASTGEEQEGEPGEDQSG